MDVIFGFPAVFSLSGGPGSCTSQVLTVSLDDNDFDFFDVHVKTGVSEIDIFCDNSLFDLSVAATMSEISSHGKSHGVVFLRGVTAEIVNFRRTDHLGFFTFRVNVNSGKATVGMTDGTGKEEPFDFKSFLLKRRDVRILEQKQNWAILVPSSQLDAGR